MKTRALIMIILLLPCFFLFGNKDEKYASSLYSNLLVGDAELSVYKEISLSPFKMLSTNLTFSDKDGLQKVTFAPFKLFLKKPVVFVSDTVINFAQKDGITTIGIGTGYDTSSPHGSRAKHILQDDPGIRKLPSLRPKYSNESDEEYERYKKRYENNILLYGLNRIFYEKLRNNSFKFFLGYNLQLFPIIGGDKYDKDGNELLDNEYSVKSHNFSIGFAYVLNEYFGFNIAGHYIKKRATAEEGQKLTPYSGASISAAFKIVNLDKNYKDSIDYVKYLFIPSIVLGGSVEYQKCNGENQFCEDGIKKKFVVSPFIDFKISPTTQFRIGFPIQKLTLINTETSVSLGAFVQYGLQLTGIK